MSVENRLTKDNINKILNELAKEYKRITHRHSKAEIVIAGGSAVLLRHDFRESTQDIDAWISDSTDMKRAANNVGDRLGLPSGWLNDSLKKTGSYSNELNVASTYYKTFANVIEVRIVPDECLVAMKLKAGRDYKHDYSDVAGILKENAERGCPLTYEKIASAAERLYGCYDAVPEKSWEFLDAIIENPCDEKLFERSLEAENKNRNLLDDFMEQRPQDVRPGNINEILGQLRQEHSEDGPDGAKMSETANPGERNGQDDVDDDFQFMDTIVKGLKTAVTREREDETVMVDAAGAESGILDGNSTWDGADEQDVGDL